MLSSVFCQQSWQADFWQSKNDASALQQIPLELADMSRTSYNEYCNSLVHHFVDVTVRGVSTDIALRLGDMVPALWITAHPVVDRHREFFPKLRVA